MDEPYSNWRRKAWMACADGGWAVRIPLFGGSAQGVSLNLESQMSVNLMQENADTKDAKSPAALIGTPGLKILQSYDGTQKAELAYAPVRGIYALTPPTSFLFEPLLIVTRLFIYLAYINETVMTSTGNFVIAGYAVKKTIPESFRIARFAESPTEIVIAVGGNSTDGYAFVFNKATQTVGNAIVFDAVPGDFVPLFDVVYLSGFFIGICNTATGSAASPYQQVFYAADGSSWSALDYFIPSATSDVVRRLIVKNGHLWIFKANTVPIYAPTGDADNPFAPMETATINHGCISGDAVAQGGDYIYWVGGNADGSGLCVFKTVGVSAKRISNGFVERVLQDAITSLGIRGLDGISAYCCVERGHSLYKLSVPTMKTTMVFDENTGKWHERSWWNADTGENEAEVGYVHCQWNKLSLVGDRRRLTGTDNAYVYRMGEDLLDNTIGVAPGSSSHAAGTDTVIRRERVSPHFFGKNREAIFIGDIEMEFEVGAPNAFTGAGGNPSVSLQISRDGGHTWGAVRTRTIGKIGEYRRSCIFQMNGSGYDLVFRLIMTDAIWWKLISAYADMEIAS